jgi:hypothetical protein
MIFSLPSEKYPETFSPESAEEGKHYENSSFSDQHCDGCGHRNPSIDRQHGTGGAAKKIWQVQAGCPRDE